MFIFSTISLNYYTTEQETQQGIGGTLDIEDLHLFTVSWTATGKGYVCICLQLYDWDPISFGLFIFGPDLLN